VVLEEREDERVCAAVGCHIYTLAKSIVFWSPLVPAHLAIFYVLDLGVFTT
jgi:hypothetical protein